MGKKRTTYNKLIRDRIPEIIEANEVHHKTRVLSNEEYREALLQKIVEEAQEVVEAEDRKELEKEIGDVLEVINYIVATFGLDKKHIEKTREERKKSRGGFEKKLLLEYTEE